MLYTKFAKKMRKRDQKHKKFAINLWFRSKTGPSYTREKEREIEICHFIFRHLMLMKRN